MAAPVTDDKETERKLRRSRIQLLYITWLAGELLNDPDLETLHPAAYDAFGKIHEMATLYR